MCIVKYRYPTLEYKGIEVIKIGREYTNPYSERYPPGLISVIPAVPMNSRSATEGIVGCFHTSIGYKALNSKYFIKINSGWYTPWVHDSQVPFIVLRALYSKLGCAL